MGKTRGNGGSTLSAKRAKKNETSSDSSEDEDFDKAQKKQKYMDDGYTREGITRT